jgi:hypothetical protein
MLPDINLISKRGGLDKAVYRIEQAIKKSRAQGNKSEEDQNAARLRDLLDEAQTILPKQSSAEPTYEPLMQSFLGQSCTAPNHRQARDRVQSISRPVGDQNGNDDTFAVDDAENPLQLLARASDLNVSSQAPNFSTTFPSSTILPARSDRERDHDLQAFFGPFRPVIDVDEEDDPVDMGLVTEEELDTLFD